MWLTMYPENAMVCKKVTAAIESLPTAGFEWASECTLEGAKNCKSEGTLGVTDSIDCYNGIRSATETKIGPDLNVASV